MNNSTILIEYNLRGGGRETRKFEVLTKLMDIKKFKISYEYSLKIL